jgi:addiction module RelE/StbE family toxin
MNVVWTSEAIRKLEEIEKFIAQDNPQRASGFIDQLLEKGDLTGSFPDMGRVVPELSMPESREILVGNYRIIYRRVSLCIEILTVYEGHRSFRSDELTI